MKAMGIIFANDGTIGSLTEKRTMASLPFGGRYRQVDFALSNLSAAGVRHVGYFRFFAKRGQKQRQSFHNGAKTLP